MTIGTDTYEGIALPAYGNAVIQGQTAATDVLTIEGASGQTGRYLLIQSSAAVERFAIGATNFTHKFVLGTVALASLATDAAVASVALVGLTTNHVVQIFGKVSTPLPTVFCGAADELHYANRGAKVTAAMTVNYLAWLTV